jgi:hypothetical protein
MKKSILPILLIAASFNSNAQTKTYAFTSENVGSYDWSALREINIEEGKFEKDIYTKDFKGSLVTSRTFPKKSIRSNFGFNNHEAIAAAAYDKANNRLYFANMFSPDLKYIDLNNNKEVSVKIITADNFSIEPKTGENNIFTRMCFDNKGFGYALTNDGNNLVKFSTGEDNTITNLGALKDSYKNTTISVHTQCTSWGGDMVGDVYGNLYLVSLRNNVFKINTTTLEAEFIGNIKNLPADFTTNGVAADEDGNLLICSANNAKNYYRVNPATWQAVAIAVKGNAYNVSDLANGNLVYQNRRTNNTLLVENKLSNINIFPNPVVNKNVQLQFNIPMKGSFNLVLTTVEGKTVTTNKVELVGERNKNIQLNKSITPGAYLLRMVDLNGKQVYNNTIIVQ